MASVDPPLISAGEQNVSHGTIQPIAHPGALYDYDGDGVPFADNFKEAHTVDGTLFADYFKVHGYTDGCDGCQGLEEDTAQCIPFCALSGAYIYDHSDECIERMQKPRMNPSSPLLTAIREVSLAHDASVTPSSHFRNNCSGLGGRFQLPRSATSARDGSPSTPLTPLTPSKRLREGLDVGDVMAGGAMHRRIWRGGGAAPRAAQVEEYRAGSPQPAIDVQFTEQVEEYRAGSPQPVIDVQHTEQVPLSYNESNARAQGYDNYAHRMQCYRVKKGITKRMNVQRDLVEVTNKRVQEVRDNMVTKADATRIEGKIDKLLSHVEDIHSVNVKGQLTSTSECLTSRELRAQLRTIAKNLTTARELAKSKATEENTVPKPRRRHCQYTCDAPAGSRGQPCKNPVATEGAKCAKHHA